MSLVEQRIASLESDAVALSVIVPAYNEQGRIAAFLATARAYLDAVFPDRYEIIVVDDGSTDGTLAFLEAQSATWPQLAVLRHLENLGKGAAVKSGMACARGDLQLFADADGATPIAEEARLRQSIAGGADIAIGSRVSSGSSASQCRTFTRGVIGLLFQCLSRAILRLPIKDTQCGFKLFCRDAAQRLFADLSETGFAFDLELLALARIEGYRVAEVSVVWREIPGSKVRIVRDSWRMVKSLVTIRRSLHQAALAPDIVRPRRFVAAIREVAVK